MDQKVSSQMDSDKETPSVEQADKKKARKWQKPSLEDVSGRIMAQPYIRFT